MTMEETPDRNDGDPLYREDFAAWLDVQAVALRERRFAALINAPAFGVLAVGSVLQSAKERPS